MHHAIPRLLILAVALSACETPIQGHYEINREAPFDRYATFAWITSDPLVRPAVGVVPGEQVRVSPIMEGVLREAVDRNLLTRGYSKRADPQSADLIVSFSVGARDKIQVTSYPSHAGYRYGAWGGGWQSDVRTYTEGVLAIDVFDARARRAVWHGWATKRLGSSTDQAKRTATLNEAVDAILAEFPYRNTQQ